MKSKVCCFLSLCLTFLILCGFAYEESDMCYLAHLDYLKDQKNFGEEAIRTGISDEQKVKYYVSDLYGNLSTELIDLRYVYDYDTARDQLQEYQNRPLGHISIVDHDSEIIFIGDSRIYLMMDDNLTAPIDKNEQETLEKSVSWICEGGQGLDWFNRIAYPVLTDQGDYKGKTIVIALGLNDILDFVWYSQFTWYVDGENHLVHDPAGTDINKVKEVYKNRLTKLCEEWQDCNICVATVMPIEGSKESEKNQLINSFNEMLRKELPNQIQIIDAYDAADKTIQRIYRDPLHFDAVTNYEIEKLYYDEAKKMHLARG